MNRSTSKKTITSILSKMLVVLTCLVLGLGVFGAAVVPEAVADVGSSMKIFGDSGFQDEGYTEDLIGNGSWDKDIIADSSGVNESYSEDEFTDSVSTLLNHLAIAIMSIGILVAVIRFAGRGILELTHSHSENAEAWKGAGNLKYDPNDMPRFFLTGKEREGNHNPAWVKDMIVETGIMLLIAFSAMMLLVIIGGIVQLVFEQGMNKMPSEMSNFQVGTIDVQTRK